MIPNWPPKISGKIYMNLQISKLDLNLKLICKNKESLREYLYLGIGKSQGLDISIQFVDVFIPKVCQLKPV